MSLFEIDPPIGDVDGTERPHVVLGGGPAGLTAGYLMAKAGKKVIVLEADEQVGGIAKTVVDPEGFRFDLGGHRFFTKSKEVNDLWLEIMGDEFLMRGRMRNSSPMISSQRSLTSLDFVKKRCPPRSKRKPSGSTTVLAMPPTCSSASRTMTFLPALASRYPAVSPAGPPPSTTCGRSVPSVSATGGSISTRLMPPASPLPRARQSYG